MEFDGDFLESIRYFDPESQRSSGRVEYATLASSIESSDVAYTGDIFDYLDNPTVVASSYELNNLQKKKTKKQEVFEDLDDLDEELIRNRKGRESKRREEKNRV